MWNGDFINGHEISMYNQSYHSNGVFAEKIIIVITI